MLVRELTEKYAHSDYQCTITVDPQGLRCENEKLNPDCPGWQPYITITAHPDKSISELHCIIMAECDECRQRSTNPYVKSSTDLEAFFTITIEGIGELSRRECHGDYYTFEEMDCISCDKCYMTYRMLPTVYNERVDFFSNSMTERSKIKAHQIRARILADDNPCREHHKHMLTVLNNKLQQFSIAMNLVMIDRVKGTAWRLSHSVRSYVYWWLPYDKIICGREQHLLILLAHSYDPSCLFSQLPMEILRMILSI